MPIIYIKDNAYDTKLELSRLNYDFIKSHIEEHMSSARIPFKWWGKVFSSQIIPRPYAHKGYIEIERLLVNVVAVSMYFLHDGRSTNLQVAGHRFLKWLSKSSNEHAELRLRYRIQYQQS